MSIDVQGTVLGYSSNSVAEIIMKGDINVTIPPGSAPIVLEKGNSPFFDECGAWLNTATVVAGTTIIGWYHAECWCNYTNNAQTHKSIAYALSTDGGLSFQKIGYPDNQIITGSNTSIYGRQNGQGDQSFVVGNDGYYYLHFYDWDLDHPAVARSLISSGGKPGTWYKYCNGSYSEPGIGGKTSAIPNLNSHTVVQHESGLLMGIYGQGIGANFGLNSLTWSPTYVPILYSDPGTWSRNAQSLELVAYATLGPLNGSGPIENECWAYYTYLLPGQGFNDRYFIKRLVTFSMADSEITPQSGTALSRYVAGNDYWTTTSMVTSNYGYDALLGYVLPQNYEGTVPVYDCYITMWQDHMLGVTESECSENGVVLIRTLGWVYSSPPQSATSLSFIPIYRCFNSADDHHYVSTTTDCDNKGKMEFAIGYILEH